MDALICNECGADLTNKSFSATADYPVRRKCDPVCEPAKVDDNPFTGE